MEWEGEEKSEMRCVLNLDKHNYTQLAMCIAHLHAVACGKVGALGTLVARRLCSSRSPDTWRGQAWDCLRLSWRHRKGTGTDQAAQSQFWSRTNHISRNSSSRLSNFSWSQDDSRRVWRSPLTCLL